jgi:glycerol-1-phosphate dehydrogenase [NAD(P)+]
MVLPEGLGDGLDTKFFLEGPGCLAGIPELLGRVNPEGLPALLVCDENTREAAGLRVGEILAGAGIPFTGTVLPPRGERVLSPDYERVIGLRDMIRERGAFPVAVGSGVINDLVKRAAFEAGRPYLCAATACSMDGYASFGAALVKEGFKLTLPCPAPAAVAADTDVLRAAPYDMTASGYGDLYAKLASGLDWLLADRLGLEPVDRRVWDLVQGELPGWLAAPERLKEGDPGAFAGLFKGLTMSGIAMQIYRDSRPASGAEHLLSHVWEMAHLSREGVPYSHGFKVAAGTALSTALMEALYRLPPERFSPGALVKKRGSWADREAAVRRAFPDRASGEEALAACRAKWPEEKAFAARLERLIAVLPEMRRSLEERLGSRDRVSAALKKAGCPAGPGDLGLGPGAVREALVKAQMIRKRYTVLDAAWELGLLEELAEEGARL